MCSAVMIFVFKSLNAHIMYCGALMEENLEYKSLDYQKNAATLAIAKPDSPEPATINQVFHITMKPPLLKPFGQGKAEKQWFKGVQIYW